MTDNTVAVDAAVRAMAGKTREEFGIEVSPTWIRETFLVGLDAYSQADGNTLPESTSGTSTVVTETEDGSSVVTTVENSEASQE